MRNNTSFRRHRQWLPIALAVCLCGGGSAAFAASEAAATAESPSHRGEAAGRHPGGRDIDLALLRERFSNAFDRVDSNDDDRISPAELAAAGPMALGHGPRGHGRHGGPGHGRWYGDGPHRDHAPADRQQGLGELFSQLDTDRDGKLSNSEFAKLPDARRTLRTTQAFARLDHDGNGALDRSEFPRMLARLEALDVNRDGKVSRDEMRAGREQRMRDRAAPGADRGDQRG